MLVNTFYTTLPQKVEYVLSYAGRCFQPEMCFYGLFLPFFQVDGDYGEIRFKAVVET